MKKFKIAAIFLAVVICILALTSCKDKNGVPQRAKAGVAVIAKATNASVLPVAICCDGPIKAGKKLTVSYGKLITPEEMNFNKEDFASSDIRKAANLVMDRITELWEAEVK